MKSIPSMSVEVLSRGLPLAVCLALLLVTSTPTYAAVGAAPSADEKIHALLDGFHRAAAEADEQAYLAHFAPDGVFMGTDDWERWPLEEFTAYVAERFANGVGWVYTPESREVMYAPDGTTAWFDEIVVSSKWGRFRGTGVLLKLEDGWRIAHYSLTALVPNERFAEVSAVTTAGFDERAAKATASQVP